MTQRGGFLIRIDEERRAALMRQSESLEDGFSDALSIADWPLKQWEVCGLLLRSDTITHWALAQRRGRVATWKDRIAFTHLIEAGVKLSDIEALIGARLRHHLVRSSSGEGGKVPPATWDGIKNALRTLDPSSLESVEYLEVLRDEGRSPYIGPGAGIIGQQRDATGLALEIFDPGLRRKVLSQWRPPRDKTPSSFLEGLSSLWVIEDQLIARDSSVFPGSEEADVTIFGAVFEAGGRRIEVFNVNRTEIERQLGVDLLYYSGQYKAWTLVQYKMLEEEAAGSRTVRVYRPDATFGNQIMRMRAFNEACGMQQESGDQAISFRLCSDGFYFKFCSRIVLESLSSSLSPGMYLPREYVEALFRGDSSLGPRGGRIISFESVERHIDNTTFSRLVRDGWIGTSRMESERIAELVRLSLARDRAVVIARDRSVDAPADMAATLAEVGIKVTASEGG
jgi:hypothetical protein